MAASSFRFVSPGVFVNEIDNSQLPAVSNQVGPTIIGRFEKGPAMRPVYITSRSQFLEVFGKPIPGNSGDDVWRDGNYVGPTYAAYAAQAWLRNTPALNVIRLLGTQHEQATDAGKAGWETTNAVGTTDAAGGAYGLFIMPSASSPTTAVTGTLAAVFYLQQGSVVLTGTVAGGSELSGTNVVVQSTNPYGEFRAVVTGPSSTYTSNFNFNPDSDKYIRKVFNTNPILTNSDITTTNNLEHYWVGETFERSVEEVFSVGGYDLATANTHAFIAPLVATSNAQLSLHKFRAAARPAKTGWIIGQDLTNNTGSFVPSAQQKLFRVVTLDSGEYEQKNYKISISEVKAPVNDYESYGTFTLDVRLASDKDNRPVFLERFANVNLNPASPDYIARRVGDKFVDWDETEKRLKEYGTYTNISKYIRIEMVDDVDAGNVDPTYLPFGFFGPPRFKSFAISSSVTGVSASQAPAAPVTYGKVRTPDASKFLVCSASITASIVFPSIPLRVSASDGGLTDPTQAYFGITTGQKVAKTIFDSTYLDLTRAAPSAVADDGYDWGTETYGEWSFVFSLDDVSGSAAGGTGAVYNAGSRALGTSITAVASTGSGAAAGYRAILSAGYDSFTMPLYNGFDGFDVTESEPLRNTSITSTSERENHVYYTYKRAIDTVADPETLVTDIVAIPGLTNTDLTNHLVATCEARADALAIIDLPNVYKPESEGTVATKTGRYTGNVTQAAQGIKDRGINSSYGATYYPWVQVRADNNRAIFVPPSVVALGAISYGQSTQELWFAPAGFTRGGLSEGRGGIPVLGVTQKLSSKERDTLYEANINPIAYFPAEGVVIYGQKTLQVTPSALDRINVRRMMIFVKREISRIAARLIFDQNVEATWNRFLGQVNPFLASVKSRLGLTDYRVILDKTTTTPDLIDRNIMYAKIFLKPARAIEFIAIDFTITDSGASFND
jgi:hypothetical protein